MGEVETQLLSVLFLRGSHVDDADIVRWFEGHARVVVVDSLDEARRAVEHEHFDIIVSDSRDFLPLERTQLSQQATAILKSVSQGISIVDRNGQLVWSNPKMLEYSTDVRDRVCQWCSEVFTTYDTDPARATALQPGRRLWLTTADDHHLEITATPIMDPDNRVNHVAAVVWDATQARRLREKIDAIDRAGFELVRLDAEQIAKLNASQRLDLLEQKIIRYTRELMRFDNFSVRVLDRKTNKLDLVLSAGMSDEALSIDVYAEPEGNGIVGYVASTGRSYICPDVSKDPRYQTGICDALSSLTVPIRLHDQIIGVFNVESSRPAAFGEDDRQTAEIFARHVAVALHILNLLDNERFTTTGKLGHDVLAEITGPVNDILTDVANLVEDYIGHDELRHRLSKISDNAVKIRDSIKQMTKPQRGVIIGRTPSTRLGDPALAGKRILVVDDEEVIRDTVHDILSGAGCDVAVADDAPKAIEMIQADSYDLVLSDIRMPCGTGYEVFAAAKEADEDCPVILMTGFGYDPNHTIIRARKEGLAAVLFKPFKVDQLVGEIRNAIRATV